MEVSKKVLFHWALAVLAVVLTACSVTGPPAISQDPQVRKAQEQISFKLVLPRSVPNGFALKEAALLPSPDGEKTVRLVFQGPNGASIVVEEAPYAINIGVDRVKMRELGDREVQYQEEGEHLQLTFFTSKKVGLKVQARNIPRETFLEFVRSML